VYTEVSFGLFLETLLEWAKREKGIEFDEYPNISIPWREGDWLYEILGDFSVRVFRWLQQGAEKKIDGPRWDNLKETREEFERRFEQDFKGAVSKLLEVK
jgi:hypothetical protein